VVSAEVEEVGDGIVNGDKALKMPGQLESFHLTFALAGWLMGVLGPVVEPLVLAVLDLGHDLPFRRAV
jgi:hypothetical protein